MINGMIGNHMSGPNLAYAKERTKTHARTIALLHMIKDCRASAMTSAPTFGNCCPDYYDSAITNHRTPPPPGPPPFLRHHTTTFFLSPIDCQWV